MKKEIELIKSFVGENFSETLIQIDEAVKVSSAISIVSETHIDEGARIIKAYKLFDKQIETYRKNITQPINDNLKSINDAFKYIRNKFKPELDRLSSEMQSWLKKKRELEELERAKEQKELDDFAIEEAEMFGDADVTVQPEVMVRREKLSDKTEHLKTMRVKKWKVTDLDKIPREYLIIDEKMINSIRKLAGFDDSSSIPGIVFYTDEVPRL